MAHWAEINESNEVVRVVVGSNDEPDEGYRWLIDNLGGTWIQTSYNTHGGIHYGPDGKPDGGTPLRKNYAGIGFTYDPVRDAFIPIKPDCHPLEISFEEESCTWLCSNTEHEIVEAPVND